MDYIERLLKVKVKYSRDLELPLPYLLVARYRLQKVVIGDVETVFVYPKLELERLSNVKKHIKVIAENVGMPVVLICKNLILRQREALIDEGIPFVVENTQVYLPFLGIMLQERTKVNGMAFEKLLPSAQLLLLYYIYQSGAYLYLNGLSEKLRLSSMSVSRAAKQLEAIGFMKSGKDKVKKYIFSNLEKEKLFEAAKEYLDNPIKRVVYVDRQQVNDKFVLAGDSALAEYTMLNQPRITTYAVSRVGILHNPTNELLDYNNQVEVQLWIYDPNVLAENGLADKLALALSYLDDDDERVAIEVEHMLRNLWEGKNGNRG